MNNYVISVVIPVYQTEKYLTETLMSVVEAVGDLQNVEVLMIDDGSRDGSAAICKTFADKYSYFVYFPKENEGVSATRNKGVELAKGSFVCFLDSDDLIDKNYFTNVLEHIGQEKFDI